MTTEAVKDYLGMSDEDFLNAPMPVAPAAEPKAEEVVDQGATPGSDVSEAVDTEAAAAAETQENEEVDGNAADGETEEQPGDDKTKAKDDDESAPKPGDSASGSAADTGAGDDPSKAAGKDPKADAVKTDADKAADKAKDPEKKEEPAKPVDYEAFFKQIMTPFKANGRTIELKTPEEAIRLMQMGAGYGRKIQDLQPALKTLRMLEKADLLDEGKLSYLIDINNKNPDAIKKLIKDAGIDPLDLNIADNVSYVPKNHSVSDQEVAFQEALTEIQAHEGGQATLQAINQTWDQESKSALWQEPQLLGVIQSQRDTGIYDQIVAEIDRQKLLGHIPNSTPFLKAYKLAGDHLQANNGFKAPIQTQPVVTQQPQVIATRTAAPKPQVQNGDKAAAASATKTTPRKAATAVNPLEMADDDFLKQFNGRL
ncbi:hypothetical protein [Mesorhizobium sp. M4B.F.Ca.ET.058.02.1.1]|uniref:hypothetical protein n=1 Tax=Mesorhizobium sp. M4B.F.Ca.ET.058.02.1.1 TaxID=2493675 RepID=UPI000F74E7B1|nr:hypothetical protein [Mesorhizobium sp. M4B.F.Ca.ET.058.02.1.1]AZO48048.1 hypothetical protein EJ073_09615 [Mesorhizobium sp. M4B.F.Ca.ET.058.02.1.1]